MTGAEQQEKIHWGFWLGLVFFIFVVIGILSLAWFLNKKVAAQESAPVTSVMITGEMPYTTEQDVLSAIETEPLGNFFRVDVNRVQEKVGKLPWVYSVSVRKQWPDQLKVYVVDQKPIAFWNGEFFLNEFGKAFQADAKRLKQRLPAFFGPEGSENTALENFHNLNGLLAYSQLGIEELVLSERYSWQLTLTDGVTLNLGREERVERIQRFMDVYPTIKNNETDEQQVDYVDLRYDTGVAVGWKPIKQEQKSLS